MEIINVDHNLRISERSDISRFDYGYGVEKLQIDDRSEFL